MDVRLFFSRCPVGRQTIQRPAQEAAVRRKRLGNTAGIVIRREAGATSRLAAWPGGKNRKVKGNEHQNRR